MTTEMEIDTEMRWRPRSRLRENDGAGEKLRERSDREIVVSLKLNAISLFAFIFTDSFSSLTPFNHSI